MHETITTASAAALATYGSADSHETIADVYYEALGAVPPVFNATGFWLGEPYSHDPDGCEVCLQFWTEQGYHAVRYLCRYSRLREGTPPRGLLLSFS